MQTIALTVGPALSALVLFGLIVMGRRVWRGEAPFQAMDGEKAALVLGHVMPLFAACMLYNAVSASQSGIGLEIAAMAVVFLALGIAIYRYLEAVNQPIASIAGTRPR